MDKKRVDEVLNQVLDLLGEFKKGDSSVLFISGDGAFAMSGERYELLAELILSMVRYPAVRDLVIEATIRYPAVKKEYGDKIMGLKMTRQVEKNTGNPEGDPDAN